MAAASHSYGEIAWDGGLLSRIDARVKIAGAALLLVLNLVAGSMAVSLLIAAAMMAVMSLGRIPYRRQLISVSFPASFALFAVLSQTVFYGGTVFASVGPVDLHREGLMYGLYIATRILGGALVVVVLGVTTPINRFCLALRWFRVPVIFVEILQLAYRYLLDLYGELFRMRDAQRVRLGWTSPRRGLASSRMLAGALFLRVYDRGLAGQLKFWHRWPSDMSGEQEPVCVREYLQFVAHGDWRLPSGPQLEHSVAFERRPRLHVQLVRTVPLIENM